MRQTSQTCQQTRPPNPTSHLTMPGLLCGSSIAVGTPRWLFEQMPGARTPYTTLQLPLETTFKLPVTTPHNDKIQPRRQPQTAATSDHSAPQPQTMTAEAATTTTTRTTAASTTNTTTTQATIISPCQHTTKQTTIINKRV